MTTASNVILVHGAWADGSSWSKVIPLLLDGGLRVSAVQLPLISLKDDVTTVKRAIALEGGPIILVGHSYGGVVITEAGDDPKVAGLVYIAAFAPDVGQSVGSLGASVEPAPMGAEVRPDAQGFLKLTEAGVKNDFAQDLTLIEKNILFAAQAPTAAAVFGENVSVASWKAKPSWYLVATADRAIQPSLERAMAKNINPLLAERAVEAGMIFGLSNAMSERITLAGGAPEQTNFDTYEVLRIDQTPDVAVEIISVGEEPGSFGEVGTMPVGTALGNAIFSATGKRLRAQPFGGNGVTFV